jgi:BirA family biotin operon repressor/biotin-[acetyl-CoA-carboxylase] ligase
VRLTADASARIGQPAVDLETACGRHVDRNLALGAVLAELVPMLERFAMDGFAPFRDAWQRLHAHQGSAVSVTLARGEVKHGVAVGVADDGALLFQDGAGVRRLHSAEVSLRETPRPRLRAVRNRV